MDPGSAERGHGPDEAAVFETDSRTVAELIDGEHAGETVRLTGVESLSRAGEHDLAFCVYDTPELVHQSGAGAIIVPPDLPSIEGQTHIVVEEPRLGFALATEGLFADPPDDEQRLVHPTATVHEDAEVGTGTRIGPYVYVGDAVSIGEECIVRAGSVIGCAGFGFARDESGVPHHLRHQGRVRIEDGVAIGPNCSIDRAVFDETVVGQNSKLSGHVHLGHQTRIGRNVLVAFAVGFGGGAAIHDRVMIHPHASIAEGVVVGEHAEVGMNSAVLEDVPAGATVVGSPARVLDRRDADQSGTSE